MLSEYLHSAVVHLLIAISMSDISPINHSADPHRSPVKVTKRVTLETPPSPSPKKSNAVGVLTGTKRKTRHTSEEPEDILQ